MTTIRNKLPSKQEALLVFSACVFLVYGWTIVVYFWEVPSWQKYLATWDIASILAYALASDLIESVFVFSVLVLLRIVLPLQLFRDRFVAKATALLFTNAFWALLLHLVILSDQIIIWSAAQYVLAAILYLLSVCFSWAFIQLSEFFGGLAEAFVDRLTVFLYLYVPLSAFSILVVIARNIL